jgi:stearoyl-CoA desaturase (delta-9 desaturase)
MWAAGYAFWYCVIGSLGISLGFHRYLAHKSFTTYKWFEILMIYSGCLATGGTPMGWAGTHRLHHAYCDTEKDPHSPKILGGVRAYFHLWNPFEIPKGMVRDLLKNPHVRFCQQHYFKILFAWAGLLFLIDPLLMLFGYCLPAVFAFHAYSHVNAISHLFGYRTYDLRPDDSSTNNWWVNVLAPGEGWHNNHHKYPNRYRNGFKWWELDIGARTLETFGLMKTHRSD